MSKLPGDESISLGCGGRCLDMRAAGLLCSEGGLVGIWAWEVCRDLSVCVWRRGGGKWGREASSVHGAEVRHPVLSVSFRKLNIPKPRKKKCSPLP